MLKKGGQKIHVGRISAFDLLTFFVHQNDFIALEGEIVAPFLTGTKTAASVMNKENRIIEINSNQGMTNDVP